MKHPFFPRLLLCPVALAAALAFGPAAAAPYVYGPGDYWQRTPDGRRAAVPAKLLRDGARRFRADAGDYHLTLGAIEPGEYVLRLEMREQKRSRPADPLGRRMGVETVLFREGRPIPFARMGAIADGYYTPETDRVWLKPGDVLTLAGLDGPATGYDRFLGALTLARDSSPDAFETLVDLSSLNDPSFAGFGKTALRPGLLALDIRNRTGVPRPLRVEVEILDYWQKTLAKFDETRETAGAFTASVPFAPDGCDNYRAWIHVTDAKTGRLERKILFCDADVLTGPRKGILLDPLDWEYAWTADDGTYETRRMKDFPDPDVKWTKTTLPEGRIRKNLVSGELVNQQWYRTRFVLPAEMRGERTFLTVGVSHIRTRLFVNGKSAGENEIPDQCLPFEVEVTDLLCPGTNDLHIAAWGCAGNFLDEDLKTLPKLIPARSLKGAFGSYHGQLSTVRLVTRPKTFIAKLPRVLTSVKDSTVEVLDEAPPGTVIRHRILHKGREVVPPFAGKVKWNRPILWGPAPCAGRHAPDLFPLLELESTLYPAHRPSAAPLDRLSQRFGFREFTCEGPDFKWNGKPFRGIARCHVPEYGRYPWEKSKQSSLDWLERVAFLDTRFVGHAMGQNFFYDWADELGVLICRNTSMMCVGEMSSQYRDNPTFWANKRRNDLKAIDLYPNHPSMYVWYLSNEFGLAHNRYGADLMRPILEAVDAKDPSRFAEVGCDLDLGGAAKFHSVHYPVYNAFREEETFLPDCFYWRPLDRRFTPGCRVPFGQSVRVCNVIGDSMVTWGVKPIQAHETGWDHFMDFPHSPSQIWGEEAYNGPGMIQRMHAEYNKWYIEGHRDALCFHVSPWRKYHETRPDDEAPPLDVVVIQKYHAFYAGTRVRYDANVFHDVPDEESVEYFWELRDAARKTVAAGGRTYRADGCRTFRETVDFTAPPPGRYRLDFGLRGKVGKSLPIETYARGPAADDDRVIAADEPLTPAVVARAAAGETVVVLARDDYPDLLPVRLTTNHRNAAVNFTFRPDHPALAGLTARDLSFWYPKSCTGWGYFDKPASGGVKTLVEAGGPAGLSYAALVEVPVGKGTMFFTRLEMDADARAENPIAARLLGNLLAYRRAPTGGTLGVALDPALVAALRADGVELAELRRDGSAGRDLSRFAALYVDGRAFAPADVASFPGRVFVRDPGPAWGVVTSTNGVPLYAGRALKVRKGHPLLRGLTNFDFFFRKRADTIVMHEHLTDPKCRLADVGGAQIVGGATALVHPAYLAERGNLVFETLNWTAAPTPEVRDQAERLVTTLLANAGVTVVPPLRTAAQKRVRSRARYDPERCARLVRQADGLKAAKKYADAIGVLKKAQNADARVLSVYNDIGALYEILGDTRGALLWYRKSLDFDFNQPPVIRKVKELEKPAPITVEGPDHMRAYRALKALRKDEKVFVASPAARTVEEADVLFAEAAKRPGSLAVGDLGPLADADRATLAKVRAFGTVRRVTVRCRTAMPCLGMKRPGAAEACPDERAWQDWIGVMPLRPYYRIYTENEGWRAFLDFGTGPIGRDGARLLRPVFLALGLGKPETARRLSVDGAASDRETYPKKVSVRFVFAGGVEIVWTHGPDEETSVVWENGRGETLTTAPAPPVARAVQLAALARGAALPAEAPAVTETVLLGCAAMMTDRPVTAADCEKPYRRDGWTD